MWAGGCWVCGMGLVDGSQVGASLAWPAGAAPSTEWSFEELAALLVWVADDDVLYGEVERVIEAKEAWGTFTAPRVVGVRELAESEWQDAHHAQYGERGERDAGAHGEGPLPREGDRPRGVVDPAGLGQARHGGDAGVVRRAWPGD